MAQIWWKDGDFRQFTHSMDNSRVSLPLPHVNIDYNMVYDSNMCLAAADTSGNISAFDQMPDSNPNTNVNDLNSAFDDLTVTQPVGTEPYIPDRNWTPINANWTSQFGDFNQGSSKDKENNDEQEDLEEQGKNWSSMRPEEETRFGRGLKSKPDVDVENYQGEKATRAALLKSSTNTRYPTQSGAGTHAQSDTASETASDAESSNNAGSNVAKKVNNTQINKATTVNTVNTHTSLQNKNTIPNNRMRFLRPGGAITWGEGPPTHRTTFFKPGQTSISLEEAIALAGTIPEESRREARRLEARRREFRQMIAEAERVETERLEEERIEEERLEEERIEEERLEAESHAAKSEMNLAKIMTGTTTGRKRSAPALYGFEDKDKMGGPSKKVAKTAKTKKSSLADSSLEGSMSKASPRTEVMERKSLIVVLKVRFVPEEKEIMSGGFMSSGLGSEGLGSRGLTSQGWGSQGLMSEGLASPGWDFQRWGSQGLMSEGLASQELASQGWSFQRLASQGLMSEGLASRGLASQGWGSQGMGSQGLMSNSMMSQGTGSQGLASQGWGSQGMASQNGGDHGTEEVETQSNWHKNHAIIRETLKPSNKSPLEYEIPYLYQRTGSTFPTTSYTASPYTAPTFNTETTGYTASLYRDTAPTSNTETTGYTASLYRDTAPTSNTETTSYTASPSTAPTSNTETTTPAKTTVEGGRAKVAFTKGSRSNPVSFTKPTHAVEDTRASRMDRGMKFFDGSGWKGGRTVEGLGDGVGESVGLSEKLSQGPGLVGGFQYGEVWNDMTEEQKRVVAKLARRGFGGASMQSAPRENEARVSGLATGGVGMASMQSAPREMQPRVLGFGEASIESVPRNEQSRLSGMATGFGGALMQSAPREKQPRLSSVAIDVEAGSVTWTEEEAEEEPEKDATANF